MRFRRPKPPQRESLVAREARLREERTQTQGWDRFHVRTVGPSSLEGPDGFWEGKWLFAGDRLTGIVRAIKENDRPLPMVAGGGVPKVYRVSIEKPWRYADLPRQHVFHPWIPPKIRAGLTEHFPR